ncbi:hypothetical protein [Bacillus safensis]|uniref:hypothetical protein n=1 Tax=Bacillus safensis TaxID=561879 RepID=UPI000B767B1B|nr:hypothetical protein [Bacillus safensis]UDB47309.1 hypothetical protein B0X07_18365 [Bacillus safensis]
MNIREWFGLEAYSEETEAHYAVDNMLKLCREALTKYFSVTDSENIHDLIQLASKSNIDTGFLDWLLEKGLPQLNNINFAELPNLEKFVSMINIDIFVLENEMDFSDPEEVRGCIISFVNSLSEYISLCTEVSVSIEEEITTSSHDENFINIQDKYIFMDEPISQTSIWESAEEQVPFFMEEFKYGNVRILQNC